MKIPKAFLDAKLTELDDSDAGHVSPQQKEKNKATKESNATKDTREEAQTDGTMVPRPIGSVPHYAPWELDEKKEHEAFLQGKKSKYKVK